MATSWGMMAESALPEARAVTNEIAADSKPAPHRHSVFLVDEHPLVREGLDTLISQQADKRVCGQAENAGRAYDAIASIQPEIVVMDLSLRGDSGLDLIKRLQLLKRPPRVLVLSMHDEAFYAERALRAGALG